MATQAAATSYVVSFDRDILAPGTTERQHPGADPTLMGYLIKAQQPIERTQDVLCLGYDDISWPFAVLEEAVAFAQAMDRVIPGPMLEYRRAYQDGLAVHHATIGEYREDPTMPGCYGDFVDVHDPWAA